MCYDTVEDYCALDPQFLILQIKMIKINDGQDHVSIGLWLGSWQKSCYNNRYELFLIVQYLLILNAIRRDRVKILNQLNKWINGQTAHSATGTDETKPSSVISDQCCSVNSCNLFCPKTYWQIVLDLLWCSGVELQLHW